MTHRVKNYIVLILACFLLAVLLIGCAGPVATPSATATPVATEVPPTPTSAPAELVFVTAQTDATDPVTKLLSDFAAANSLQFRTLVALTAADMTSGTKIVVVATAQTDVNSLPSGNPAAQFILLGSSNPGISNVSTIQAKPEDEAFMAGYLTMLIAQDWRAGALLTSDGAAGSAYADDFSNGSQFVCGKCNPFYSPIVAFPVTASEPAASASGTWAADAAALSQNWLSSVFITPSAASADVITAVSSHTVNSDGVYYLSTTGAPQDGSIPWAALLTTDYSAGLNQLLPQALKGQGNLTIRAQIGLTAINADIVTPAKQALFNQTAADLAADLIIPTTVQ